MPDPVNGPWLQIIGIGEDGVEGLSPAARLMLERAPYVIGGARHLALARALIHGDGSVWPSPFSGGVAQVLARRGQPTVVLASGDPFFFGVGSVLARHVPAHEMICVPSVSCISLACARLGWAQQDVRVLSLCGRPIETVAPFLQNGARLLILSADGTTPGTVARFLTAQGFGPSVVHVLEVLGGPDERVRSMTADADIPNTAALNLVAIDVVATSEARTLPLSCGLDDNVFEHDGQITKREIRAVTLSSLAPRAGELLWDVGAGAGSVGIEWMLRGAGCRTIAIEQHDGRLARIRRNALVLGVPGLRCIAGRAPDILAGLEQPDAAFIGGGLTVPGCLETVWQALRPGGRLVANAVTLEGEQVLARACSELGGTLLRLGVERLDGVGRLHAFRPAMRVTQFVVVKGAVA